MKLLIVTCIKEHQQNVSSIFKETGIQVFSISEISGYKQGGQDLISQNWFGGSGETFESLMLFSFTEEEKAAAAIKLIEGCNKNESNGFPIRGFVLPVERFSV